MKPFAILSLALFIQIPQAFASAGDSAGGLNQEALQKAQNSQMDPTENLSINNGHSDQNDKCDCSCNSTKK